ncbi:MAG: hypothetical protein AAB559_00540 [Patescibacteria group bacterium]
MNKGQSMFEVVLALFIITLIIVAVVILSTTSISNSLFSRNKTLANKYSQEAIEWLRSQREENFAIFTLAANTPVYCLNSLAFTNVGLCLDTEIITATIFKRELTFSKSVISGKNIISATVVTSWSDSKGLHQARAVTNFSDIREQ